MSCKIRTLNALLCAALLGLAAAGDATAKSPCELLTEADVRGALGGQWQVWQDLSSEEVCAFQSSPTAVVSLTAFSDPMGAQTMLDIRRTAAGDKARAAEGLGPGAYRLVMPSANVILFGKGETVLELEVSFDASPDASVAEQLAKSAYDRLP
jgi:hypothetical protein